MRPEPARIAPASLLLWFTAIAAASACGNRPRHATPPLPAVGEGGWRVLHAETFDRLEIGQAAWLPDPVPDDGPFADGGEFFSRRGVAAPPAYRITRPLGDRGWLTAESYSRNQATLFSDLLSVVPDPGGGSNRVLRLRSPAHTDGTLLRSSRPLPPAYRISLRIGFADFGDGEPGGKNGYDSGDERAEPWWKDRSPIPAQGNGFYWLVIYDTAPRPHNNVWAHHHRKVVIDSDSCFPPWMELYDGQRFIESGRRPLMLFALDGKSKPSPWVGHAFHTWAAGTWQPSGAFRAADAYRPRTWYRAVITRRGDEFTLQVSGDFVAGGQTTYGGTIDARRHCVWHYNRDGAEMSPDCVDLGSFSELGAVAPRWPAGQGWPDYFAFGDPHVNFYEGTVYFDDVVLEVPEGDAAATP